MNAGAVAIWRLATPLMKGGDACVERTLGVCPAVLRVSEPSALHTLHKSVLAARTRTPDG